MSPTSSLCGDGLFNQSQRIHFIFSSLCPPQPQCFDMIDVSLVISGFRAVRPRFQGLGSGPGGSFTLLERQVPTSSPVMRAEIRWILYLLLPLSLRLSALGLLDGLISPVVELICVEQKEEKIEEEQK
ncbi:hypothetical protein Bca4012_072656 [Brassica carinata]